MLLRENSGGKPLTMNSSGLGVVLCKVLLVSSGFWPAGRTLDMPGLGPERPQLLTTSGLSSRRVTKTWYLKHSWITGCSHSGKVYCFPCLLFGDSQREKAWTQSGVNDWKHLSEKVK